MKKNYLIYFLLCFLSGGSAVKAQVWSAFGAGVNDRSTAFLEWNGDLYAVGLFTLAGGNSANYIAKWDGTTWSPLGSGVDDRINAIATFSNEIYVAGDFQNAGGAPAPRIAKWDGSTWSAVGINSGIQGPAHALCVFQNELYAAGSSSGGSASTLSKWNGSIWSTVSTFDNRVQCLKEYNGELYIGGQFTTVGVMPASKIIRYSGVTFTTLGGSGLNNNVYSFGIHNSELYIGGSFSALSNTSTAFSNIARWNGLNWSAVGSGCADWVLGLQSYNGRMYASGTFTLAGGNAANYIASWDGSNWSNLGTGLSGNGFSLGKYNNSLVVAGTFSVAGGIPVSNIAYWNEGVVGLKDIRNLSENFSIYPVPALDNISISPFSVNDLYGFTVYNTSGQVLIFRSEITGVYELDLSEMNSGLYILELKQNNNSWKTKLFKQ